MKGVLDLLRRMTPGAATEEKDVESLYSSVLPGDTIGLPALASWRDRAAEIGAQPFDVQRGTKALIALWATDPAMARVDPVQLATLGSFFDFASVPGGREIIRQDEYGNFMVVVLDGSVAVDRIQPWGEEMRLTEARSGDILGEMSLLDSGARFSGCVSDGDVRIAVLEQEAMDRMMLEAPQLAAAIVALLARKLSMRLRVVGARLSERQPG